jgi:glutathione S-transferase
MPELLGLPYSPWSEKAYWALEARGIAYRRRIYSPLIGELALRRKLRKWSGIVSVPVLTTDEATIIPDSAEIARWADHHGSGPVMFPPGQEAAIAAFIELSERGLAAGRALSLLRLRDDRDAVLEMVPRNLRRVPGARQLARVGIARTLRKYDALTDRAAAQTALAAVLDEIRAALAASPPANTVRTLLGEFTFADVTVAQVLAFIAPPTFGLKLGERTRRAFVDDELRERFADVVAWRDALYESHRPRSRDR